MIIIKMTAAANVEPLGTPKLSWGRGNVGELELEFFVL